MKRKFTFRSYLLLILVAWILAYAHKAWAQDDIPLEERLRKNPLPASATHLESGGKVYRDSCAGCHGMDGKPKPQTEQSTPAPQGDLSDFRMESIRDGEIYWVVTHGIENFMPASESKLSDTQCWEVVLYIRELRARRKAIEVAQLGPYPWKLPVGFPYPNVPADNPMTLEKVELGRYLFYDQRLSLNQTQSCASCHKQKLAFTDGRPRGVGSTGELHPRGAMSLANVAYSPALTWANPNIHQLEQQALLPMFGENPIELGMSGKETLLIERLKAEPKYQKLFAAAFPKESNPFTVANVVKAIASFERTIISGDSPYDRYARGGDPNAIAESAKRGELLFFGEKLECFHCHGGFNFTGTVDYFQKGLPEVEFHNTGLYNLKGKTSYPVPNTGIYEFTQNLDDVGKFKAPTLRNVMLTAPYMHDGSVKTIDDVIDHYGAGGRTIKSGPLAGVGAENPNRSDFVQGFELTAEERKDLHAFLESLTDKSFLTDPALSNPWISVSHPSGQGVEK